MKSKIIDLRSFLERNKIFFEVLAATALTVTSVFVSFKANDIANQANNIATQGNNISKIQTKIMTSENTPKIEIQRINYDDPTKTNPVTKWLVFNNNSNISNFEIESEISFLNIVKKDHKEIDIRLAEYINRQGKFTGQNEGLIYEFDNKYCSENEFLTREKISDFGDVNVKTYIEMSFINVLGKKEVVHFQISPLIQPISKSAWESRKKYSRSINTNAIYLEHIEKNIKQIKSQNFQ
ncbi:hypothetical protein [[Flexibacter] sp. ATCC 35103]|uniref:hypothetical protein n=1 Tax=[Flexibacter] sp. ATCC 35103 TaxID=1937528 RepID=UPI0009D5D2A0|nr:hypothetical protein [[Flexibacter] sp. ATCC 35103]OMQ09085.1 hypothetical protein BXU01_19255 [[Flexibacter] sp. ATCC 35103]